MWIEIEVPEYDPRRGTATLGVEPDSIIGVGSEKDGWTYLSANKQGLISLAIHLLSLAQDGTPIGRDIAYGHWNWLAPGSTPLLIKKIESADEAIPRPLEGEALARAQYMRERMRRGAMKNSTDALGKSEIF